MYWVLFVIFISECLASPAVFHMNQNRQGWGYVNPNKNEQTEPKCGYDSCNPGKEGTVIANLNWGVSWLMASNTEMRCLWLLMSTAVLYLMEDMIYVFRYA